MMDPDAALQMLREAYNEVQDETLTIESAEAIICVFDDLDNWIISGGVLPKEWRVS